MSRWQIYEVVTDADGVDCYIKRGEIIHCRECKWSKANGKYQWCGRLDSTARITADDFCSYGQKGDENVETD